MDTGVEYMYIVNVHGGTLSPRLDKDSNVKLLPDEDLGKLKEVILKK